MTKIAIVADSSIGITLKDQANIKDLFIAPLSIIHGGKEYIDQVDLSEEDVNNILRNNELIQTSQPNVGVCLELFQKIQALDYDYIIAIALSSNLSGTFNSLKTAADELNDPRIKVVDSLTIAGCVQEGVALIKHLNESNTDIDTIMETLESFYKDTVSYVIPETLDQLKASGRISAAASTLASMLKMKVLLRLENAGQTIEKFATARTDKKLFDTLLNDLKAQGFDPMIHKIYMLHSDGLDLMERVRVAINESFANVEFATGLLPAAVSGHAGIGTIAVQMIRKTSTF